MEPQPKVATIALNASQSNEIVVGRRLIRAIKMPSAWDAAALTFLGCAFPGDPSPQPIYDSDGAELSVSAAADRMISLTQEEMTLLSGPAAVILRSGTAGLPVTQTAARTIYVIAG